MAEDDPFDLDALRVTDANKEALRAPGSVSLASLRRTTAGRFAAFRRALGDGDWREGGERLGGVYAAVLAACGLEEQEPNERGHKVIRFFAEEAQPRPK